MFHKEKVFAIFFTTVGILAVYFYFNFGPVFVGTPTTGSDDLIFLKAELDRQTEVFNFENGTLNVTEYAVLGYRDIPSDISIYTLKYSGDYIKTLDGFDLKTASVVPLVMRKIGDEIAWEEFTDASYAEDFAKLPGTIRAMFNDTEKHNEIVKALESKAKSAVEKVLTGWNTYKNIDFGYQMDYPIGWKQGEYTLLNSEGKVISVAFDPESVITEQDRATFDMAPGVVEISVSDSIPTAQFEQKTIGEDNLSAAFLSDTCLEPTCPNPWWLNKTSNTYYLTLPKGKDNYSFITITMQYPKEKIDDVVLQENLKKMLASFKFI